ncbi:hypothetical protein ACPRNU_01080 [Chromobacterium vaccinii]|uniref:hypothetical protein n=1 Tax=Chromobacterium vaccinii TaxID=1108595 RepID=UPI003C73823F
MNKVLKWLAAILSFVRSLYRPASAAPPDAVAPGAPEPSVVPASMPVCPVSGCGAREMARSRRQIARGALQCSH